MQPLVFVSQSSAPNTSVTSEIVTVVSSGPETLTFTNGTLTLNGLPAISPVIVNNGDTLSLTVVSSAINGTSVNAIISDGVQAFPFRVITKGPDTIGTIPNIHFEPQIAQFNTVVTSDPIVVSGIDTITVTVNPAMSATILVNGQDTHSTSVTAHLDDLVAFQVTTPAETPTNTTYNIAVTFGSGTYNWPVIAQKPDRLPIAFAFVPQVDVPISSTATSNTVTVLGVDGVPIPATVSNGTIIQNGVNVGATATLHLNDTVAIQVTSPSTYKTAVFAVLDLTVAQYAFGIITVQSPNDYFVKTIYECSNVTDYPFVGTVDTSADVIISFADNTTTLNTIPLTSVSNTSFLNDAYVSVTDYYKNSIYVIDYNTNQVVKSVETGFNKPIALGYSLPNFVDRALPIVADFGSKKLLMLDVNTYDLRTEFYQCDAEPYSISGGFFGFVYVTFINAGKIVKYNADATTYSLTPLKTFTFPNASKPGQIWEDGRKIYVPLTCGTQVAVIDSVDDSVSYITIPGKPSCVTGDGKFFLWISDIHNNTVIQVDVNTFEIISTFVACAYPTQVTWYNNNLYVAAFQDDSVYQFDVTPDLVTRIGANTLTKSQKLPNSNYGIAADGIGEIWAVAFYANTPIVIAPPDIGVHTETFVSTIGNVKVNQTDITTPVTYSDTRPSFVTVPTGYYSATLFDKAINDAQLAPVTTSSSITLEASTNIDGYSIFVPLLSPGHASVYTVASVTTTPDPFYFRTTYGAYVRHNYVSNSVTIKGLSDGIKCDLYLSDGPLTYDDKGLVLPFSLVAHCNLTLNGVKATNAIKVQNGDVVAIDLRSLRYYTNGNTVTVTAGKYSTTWTLNNLNMDGQTDYSRARTAATVSKAVFRALVDSDITITTTTVYESALPTADFSLSGHYEAGLNTADFSTSLDYSAAMATNAGIENKVFYTAIIGNNFDAIRHANGYALGIRPTNVPTLDHSAFTSPINLVYNKFDRHSEIGLIYAAPHLTRHFDYSSRLLPYVTRPSDLAVNFSDITYQAEKLYAITIPNVTIVGLTTLRNLFITYRASTGTKIDFGHDVPADATYTYVFNSFKPVEMPGYHAGPHDNSQFYSVGHTHTKIAKFSYVVTSYTNMMMQHDEYSAMALTYFGQKDLVTAVSSYTSIYLKQVASLAQYNAFAPKEVVTNATYTYTLPKFVNLVSYYTAFAPKNLVSKVSVFDYTSNIFRLVPEASLIVSRTLKFALSSAMYNYSVRKDLVLGASFTNNLPTKFLLPESTPFTFDRADFKFFIPIQSVWYPTYWYDCFESCVSSGLFADAASALADAIKHNYLPSQVAVSQDVHGCWLWTVIITPKPPEVVTPVGGYIRGG